MTRTRAQTPIENPRSRPKRPRLERGERSREGTGDGKGKRREEEEEGEYRGVFVISSDDDDRSGGNDVALSEELQIQEILLMTMRSGKEGEEVLSLETEEEQGKRITIPNFKGSFRLYLHNNWEGTF